MPMPWILRARAVLAIALLAVLAGCELPPPSIGTLRTAGPEVTVNGRPAVDGMPIRNGDKIATGASSSARLDFRGGGHVQLAPSTDPTVSEWVEAGRCLITLEVLWGMLFGESGRCQIRLSGETSATDVFSRFVFEVAPRRDIFTLIDGRALMLRPERVEIRPREQIVVVGDRIVARQLLTPAEIERLIAWRHRFDLERIQVPSLERVPLDVARDRLAAADLRLGRIDRREVAGVPEGWVVAQRPRGGTMVQRGAVVDLEVATRPLPPREVAVPSIVGLQQADAERRLREAGLRLGQVVYTPVGQARDGTVMAQRRPAGQRVPPNTAVDVVVMQRIR
jgi:hypothetical protein